MAAPPCEDAQGEALLDMEFPVEEDVDACLAHFVFLSRLGLPNAIEAAQELADKVLWRHWCFFSVFAELGAFFVSTDNRRAAAELVLDHAATRYSFEEDGQLELVQALALFSRDRLAMATADATSTLFRDTTASSTWLNPLLTILQSGSYQSTAKLHLIEMCLWSLLDAKINDEGQRSLTTFIHSHLDALVDRGLIHEATEVFYLACVFVNNHQTVLLDFKAETYLYLHDKIEVNISQASTTDDIKDNMLIKLRLRSALLVASRSQNEKVFTGKLRLIEHLKTLDHDIDQLSLNLCSMLDIGVPSESYVAYFTRRWSLRPRIEFTNEPTALAETSMVARSPNNTPQDGIQILGATGQLFITQASGQLHVDSYHGEIHLQEPHGELHVESFRGETFINGSRGILTMRNHNGEAYLARCRGPIQVDSHVGQVFLQQPKGPIFVDRADGATHIRLPQGPIMIDRPAMETNLRLPEGPTLVDRPEMETNVRLAQGPIFVDRPAKDTYVKQSQGRVHIDCPESETYIKSPRQAVHLESPESEVTVAKAMRVIEIFKCNGGLRAYEPEGDVHINSASGEVHLHEPAKKVEVVRPSEVVHIYEPDKDVHIYNLNGKKIFVHGRSPGDDEPEVIGAKEEPCPPYSTEYEMPVFPETPYVGKQPAADLEVALGNTDALVVNDEPEHEEPLQAITISDRKSTPGSEHEQPGLSDLGLGFVERPPLPYYAADISLAPAGALEQDIKIGINAVARVIRIPTAARSNKANEAQPGQHYAAASSTH